MALPAGEAEIPIVDVQASPMPLVGPGIHEPAGATGFKQRPHLPIQHAGLSLLAVSAAVQPNLCQQQWPVAGERLEASQICIEQILGFEVDVEADEVDER
jgi:hypothetical protein